MTDLEYIAAAYEAAGLGSRAELGPTARGLLKAAEPVLVSLYMEMSRRIDGAWLWTQVAQAALASMLWEAQAAPGIGRRYMGFMDGYKPVADGGTQVPSPCGTEEANEGPVGGTATKGWAKRKFRPGPVIDYDEGLDSLPSKKDSGGGGY